MSKRRLAGCLLAAVAAAVATAPAMATDVQASLALVGAYDADWNPVLVDPAAIPTNQPLFLKVGAYAKLSSAAGATGIGAYSLDVTGLPSALVSRHAAAEFPLFDPGAGVGPIWDATQFDNMDDLKLVTGVIFPTTNGFRSNLGNGSPADVNDSVELFSFYLLTQQQAGSLTLGLAQHAQASPWGFLTSGVIRPYDAATDSAEYGTLALTFVAVPEPTTLGLLGLAGLAAWRRRRGC